MGHDLLWKSRSWSSLSLSGLQSLPSSKNSLGTLPTSDWNLPFRDILCLPLRLAYPSLDYSRFDRDRASSRDRERVSIRDCDGASNHDRNRGKEDRSHSRDRGDHHGSRDYDKHSNRDFQGLVVDHDLGLGNAVGIMIDAGTLWYFMIWFLNSWRFIF